MPLSLSIWNDVAQLHRHAAAWDDLWQRSDVASPSARAELVAQWVEHFAGPGEFRAVVVADGDRLVAALPLVGRKIKRLLTVAALPQNEWSSGGDLLLDPAYDVPAVLAQLLDGLALLPWPLVWLEEIAYEEPRWQALRTAAETTQHSCDLQLEQDRVSQIAITSDWSAYETQLDGDHRRSRRRYARKFAEAAPTELKVLHPVEPAVIHELVRQAFTIEDESWKGSEGTSVLKQTGLLAYFQNQARLLAELGHLELVFLDHGPRPVAFAYTWRSKGVRFIAKLGYDDSYRKLGPGQHMIWEYLQHLHAAPDCRLLDFWGPVKPWNRAWATHTYPIGRLILAPRRAVSQGLFYAYTALRPRWRQLRSRFGHATPVTTAIAADD